MSGFIDWCFLACLFSLMGFIFDFPGSWTDGVDSVVSTSEVGNTSGSTETSTSEGDEVAGSQDHVGQLVNLLFENFRFVEIFFLINVVFDSSVHFM